MKSLMKLEPFRTLRTWDPVDELRMMQREMDRLFDRVLMGGGKTPEATELWRPSVESYIKDGKLHIKAELPGISEKDVDVNVTGRDLVIRGERKAEKDEQGTDYTFSEISYGSFERRLLLPEGVKAEELKAVFANGILEITVPVPDAPRSRKITIESKGATAAEEKGVKKAA